MKHASSLHKAESRFLLVIGTIVILVGVPAVLSFLKSPELQAEQVRKIDTRAPASAQKEFNDSAYEPGVAALHSSTTSLIQYDCDKKEVSEEVQSNYVRLAGVPCKEFEDLEVTNKSNGFSASVIFTKGHKFTTDFIDLRAGENNLEITATKSDGSKILKSLRIVRRDPATIQK